MEDSLEEYPLTGFDSMGEPHVRRMAEGRLWLGFNVGVHGPLLAFTA